MEKESHVLYVSYYETTGKCFQRQCQPEYQYMISLCTPVTEETVSRSLIFFQSHTLHS